jgi:hypothetical protein
LGISCELSQENISLLPEFGYFTNPFASAAVEGIANNASRKFVLAYFLQQLFSEPQGFVATLN